MKTDVATDQANCLAAVIEEVKAATTKFPTWPDDPLHALGIVGEEFGELTKEVMQAVYDEPAPFPRSTKETIRAEATQLAAMALRFLQSIDSYILQQSNGHKQGGPDTPDTPSLYPLDSIFGFMQATPAEAGKENDLQSMQKLIALHDELRLGDYPFCYFEVAYTRTTDWMAWLCSAPKEADPNRKVIAKGQGMTAEAACADALAGYSERKIEGKPALVEEAKSAIAPGRAVVVDSCILGLMREMGAVEVLHASVLRGATAAFSGYYYLTEDNRVRLATAQDFEEFRVSCHPDWLAD